MKILVADDDPVNRKYLRALLIHEGYTVVECEDGLAALECLKRNKIDAVISDILMPRMDGYRLCYEIRKDESLKDTPVIVYTATYLSEADEKAALSMGADKFMRKPAVPQLIVKALQEVTASSRTGGDSPESPGDLSALREYSQVLVRKLEQTNLELALANDTLKKNEERLRFSATAGNIGIWEWNPLTDELIWNDQQKLMFGWDPGSETLTLQKFLNRMVAEDRERVNQALQTALAERTVYEAEYRVPWPDGSMHWIAGKGRGDYDGNGRCIRMMGVALDITRRKQAEDERQRSLERVRALHEINLAITSTMNRQNQLDVLLEKIEKFFSYPTVSTLRLLQRETGRLESLAHRGLDTDAWLKREPGRTLHRALQVVESRAPVIVPDIRRDALRHGQSMPAFFGLVSYAGIPLIARERVLGVLGIYTKSRHEFDPDEIEFLTTVAGQAAIAIYNAELYEEAGRSKQELEWTNRSLENSLKQLNSLYTALAPIATGVSTQDLMNGIIDRVIDVTGADAALIRLRENKTETVPIAAHRGFSEAYLTRVTETPLGGAVLWVIEHGEAIIAPDIGAEPRLKGKVQLQLGLRSCAILPVHVHGEVHGILHVASRALDHYTETQRNHLLAIARQMSIAIENRELFDTVTASRDELARANRALAESNRRLSALHAVADAASQSMNLERVLDRAIEKITEIFDFEATRIHLCRGQSDEIVRQPAFEKNPERFTGNIYFKKGQGTVGKVVESGEPLIFEDIETDPLYKEISRTKIASKLNDHFFAVFPIKSKLRVMGAMSCLGSAPRKLSSGEIQLLEALADQLAVAIENTGLYEALSLKVDELQRKTDELEKANKVKDEFLGVVSHELRTPMNVIIGYASLFKEGVFGAIKPAQQDALAKIVRETTDLLAMINTLLYATSLESEPITLETQVFSPAKLLAELRANYAVIVPPGLTLTWQYPETLPPLDTDRRKLRQILDSLIGNALKFTENGSVTVSVRVTGGENANGTAASSELSTLGARHIEFTVADTGIGVPRDRLARIFDKFYQVDSSETRRYGGVGMGLYIAKRFADLLGGTLTVESVEGERSTFTLRLPAGETRDQHGDAPLLPSTQSHEGSRRRR